MTNQTLMKLISTVAGVLLAAGGVVLIVTGNAGEHSTTLLLAGTGLVTGGVTTMFLPRVTEPKNGSGRRGGGGAGPLSMLLVLAFALPGCGASWIEQHTAVAQGMQDAQILSEPTIRRMRLTAIETAVRRAHEQGATLEEAQAARAQAEREWQCVIDAHRTYGSAVSGYVEALWLAQQTGREPATGDGDGRVTALDFIPVARRALDKYRAIASCANTLEDGALPVPGALDLAPPAWGLSRG